jgi:glutathione S-transferase
MGVRRRSLAQPGPLRQREIMSGAGGTADGSKWPGDFRPTRLRHSPKSIQLVSFRLRCCAKASFDAGRRLVLDLSIRWGTKVPWRCEDAERLNRDVRETMMKLLGSGRSPYVRKVRVMFQEKNIAYDFVEVSASGPEVAQANPLAKIPVLVRDNGKSLYDSCVIVEYLDGLVATPKLIPEAFEARIDVRRWEALGNGIMDATVEIAHEDRTPIAQRKGPEFYAKQQKKIDAGLTAMEKDLGGRAFCHGDTFTLADIACGSALAYLDHAISKMEWRKTYPGLARLAERLAARDSFKKT